MEQKTKVHAEDGKQELTITREFDLPLELVFKAHADADLLGQWMGTKVLKLESRKHGSYQLETTDGQGNVLFRANGVIHEFSPNRKISRTFEMENTPFGIQLELYEFEKLTENTSKLTVHTIYESVAQRDQVLKLPFVQGINMAHKCLEDVLSKLK
ncbi:MAG TPA: SRPBCC domain-containing protein [Puia sp.]|nr:SRPBCC domain-containing protein [Puia sp.]